MGDMKLGAAERQVTAPDRHIHINGRRVGADEPPFVIAEMSGNHNGELSRAKRLITLAKEAGADAVKMQTYRPDTITIDHDAPEFWIKGGLWDGRSLFELYGEAHTPWEWHPELFDHAAAEGITIFSAPFDHTAVDFLSGLGSCAYKIASCEAIDLPLIAKSAQQGKPLIISTGMTSIEEIADAVDTARAHGSAGLALLHCVSAYPATAEQSNLRTLCDMRDRFGTLVGLSDHTHGTAVSVAAVALGASVIEKHITIRRADGGPDSEFSLEPEEFADLVKDCRTAWTALGRVDYDRGEEENKTKIFRRSLYVVADIAKGEKITEANVKSIRPGYGLPPKCLWDVLGRSVKCDVKRGTPLSWDVVE